MHIFEPNLTSIVKELTILRSLAMYVRAEKYDSVVSTTELQGCQIFLGTIYQNGKNIPNDHKIIK
jgi:hypothetical protein